jgi:addiction module HigA family antidote
MNQKLPNPHPGEILLQDFLKPMNLSAYRLSHATDIPESGISAIVHGKRSITADTALRFSKYFGNTAKFWLGLQMDYDIEEAEKTLGAKLKTIKSFSTVSGKSPIKTLNRKIDKSKHVGSVDERKLISAKKIDSVKNLKAYPSSLRRGASNLAKEPEINISTKGLRKVTPKPEK